MSFYPPPPPPPPPRSYVKPPAPGTGKRGPAARYLYRCLGGILPALLALVLSSGSGLAAGDLFDDDYRDCPAKTRLRDGQIADLALARDAEDADEVNVSWAATDPVTWGLGPNTYSTSLVLLLDDGDLNVQTLPLGTRTTTFDGINTGREVTVQMAIVVATADGDYLISDILEKSLRQSLTAPAFHTDIRRVKTEGVVDDPDTDADETAQEVTEKTRGTFYYVGYNEYFGNYKKHPDGIAFPTRPATPRFRLGLAHAAQEDDDAREAVDFDAYIVRITDQDGDAVPEGHDMATVMSRGPVGSDRFYIGNNRTASLVGANAPMFSNVRINDGGTIRPAMQAAGSAPPGLSTTVVSVTPADLGITFHQTNGGAFNDTAVFARWPDEHRDFPVDVLASDETYTITAWAVNDDRDVISPVVSLQVRPADRKVAVTGLFLNHLGATAVRFLYVTDFTVLK